jgi:uncharacterized protein (TIGR02246 family)
MKPRPILLSTLAALALAFPAPAQDHQPADAEAAATAAANAYVAAFNKGGAKALAAMYAEDAQYVSDDGSTIAGRAAVLESLTKFFARNEGAKLDVQIESARFLTPDVLVENGLSTIDDETAR